MLNNLRKEIEKDFNRQKNYNAILSKLEGGSVMKKVKMKYVLAPTCAVLIAVAGLIGVGQLKNSHPDIVIGKVDGMEDLRTEKESLSGMKNTNSIPVEDVEDKDINVKEQASENVGTVYPDYYAGRYVDNKGNNVVLLCENTKSNQKAICKFLGITENKTTFKTAKYSYQYLTDLQAKISKAMINKELAFVTTSSVMEDTNRIKVTVKSNSESDIKKLKDLDTLGGAIEIVYNEDSITKEDLLLNKEKDKN